MTDTFDENSDMGDGLTITGIFFSNGNFVIIFWSNSEQLILPNTCNGEKLNDTSSAFMLAKYVLLIFYIIIILI